MFTKIKDQNLSLEIIHTYGAISDEMAVIRFYHELRRKYLEEALGGKVKDVLSSDNVNAVQLWSAIDNTIALIDKYIK